MHKALTNGAPNQSLNQLNIQLSTLRQSETSYGGYATETGTF